MLRAASMISLLASSNPNGARALEEANNEIIDAALSMGGTISGEHGVGTEKRQFMTRRFTPVEIAVQRAIKRVFDPDGLLNPGVLLPSASKTLLLRSAEHTSELQSLA